MSLETFIREQIGKYTLNLSEDDISKMVLDITDNLSNDMHLTPARVYVLCEIINNKLKPHSSGLNIDFFKDDNERCMKLDFDKSTTYFNTWFTKRIAPYYSGKILHRNHGDIIGITDIPDEIKIVGINYFNDRIDYFRVEGNTFMMDGSIIPLSECPYTQLELLFFDGDMRKITVDISSSLRLHTIYLGPVVTYPRDIFGFDIFSPRLFINEINEIITENIIPSRYACLNGQMMNFSEFSENIERWNIFTKSNGEYNEYSIQREFRVVNSRDGILHL